MHFALSQGPARPLERPTEASQYEMGLNRQLQCNGFPEKYEINERFREHIVPLNKRTFILDVETSLDLLSKFWIVACEFVETNV